MFSFQKLDVRGGDHPHGIVHVQVHGHGHGADHEDVSDHGHDD